MFKVYKASAGSGKTTSLVAEYLSLCLLNPKKFRHILAVTFTNNATAEMKERIVKTLQSFAFSSPAEFRGSDAAIYHILKKNPEFQHVSDTEFQQKALTLLKEMLYDYPNFTISTIDSFFQRIIRSFAFDLGINLNYNVEIDLTDCYNQTVDILLNKLSKSDPGLFGRFMFLVGKKMDEKGKWQLEGELKKMLSIIYNEDAYEAAKALDKLYQEKIQRDGREFNGLEDAVLSLNRQKSEGEKALKDNIRELQRLVTMLGDDPAAFIGGKTGFYAWVKTLSQNVETQNSASLLKAPGVNVLKAVEADSVLKKASPEALQWQPRIVEAFHKVVEAQDAIRELTAIMQYSSSLLLLFDLKAIMEDIKRRDNLFFLNESNGKIFDEIKDIDTPYIYEKIGNKYSYFFIDEFQDTSKMQWEDFKPLIKNAISAENQFGEVGKTILFGDVKQAIYRFRNGDSSLLNQLSSWNGLRENLKNDIVDEDDFHLKNLDVNYRSSKAVIEFNNLFFKYLCNNHFGGNELLNHYYEDVRQQNPSSKEGFVHVRFMTDADGDDYLKEESLRAVKDALQRGYSYGDMAILAKANKTCSEIANYLSDNNIPVISSDSLLLGSSDEVVLIMNTLKYLLNPDDKLVQLSIAEYFGNENNTQSQHLSQNCMPVEVINYISKEDGFAQFIRSLGERVDADKLLDVNSLLSFPVFTIIKELLLAYHISEADAYIVAFLDAVYDNFNAQFSDLTQCVKWWEEKGQSLSITSSKETDAVSVMSIHKSKGLQFPVVIYPMKSYRMGNGKEMAWVEDENKRYGLPYFMVKTSKSALEGTSFAHIAEEESMMTDIDNVNLIYVAHTRAADVLYIITADPEKKRGNYAKFLKGFIQSLDENVETQNFASSSQGNEKAEQCHAPSQTKDFWFGNRDFTNPRANREMHNLASLSPQSGRMYSSDFTLNSEQLLCGRNMSDKQELGVFIHDFLSKLQFFPQNEQELAEVLSAVNNAEDRQILAAALRVIMSDPSLKPYFAPGVNVLNETSILSPSGQLRRPDRIVFMDDEVMVIDYKTGKENEAYQRQLDEYCALLEQMGYRNVHSRLLYLHP
jgi:ATP-dependent exoDNAse (exonuclease V) beta subunit